MHINERGAELASSLAGAVVAGGGGVGGSAAGGEQVVSFLSPLRTIALLPCPTR